ncbi:MAG: zf-HC2 domain-containing protein [Gemmatimonas sp.]
MTDCSNAEIRDMLPDYLHEQLSVADHAEVQQHLVSCAECADELALLKTVLALRPAVSAPNVADILAKLPKPAPRVTVEHIQVAGVRDISTARSVAAKSRTNFRAWRAIAAVAVMAVGGLTIKIASETEAKSGLVSMQDSATVAELQSRVADGSERFVSDSAPAPVPGKNISLSVGDPSAYSDEELEAMMSRLDKWDGSMSADPLPGVPIIPPGS